MLLACDSERIKWSPNLRSLERRTSIWLRWLIYSMKHSTSWEANRFSASQEIPRIVWNPKVHFRVYATCSILSQINLFHVPPSHLLKIHLNIILPSTPGSSRWSNMTIHFSKRFRFIHLQKITASTDSPSLELRGKSVTDLFGGLRFGKFPFCLLLNLSLEC